MKIKSPSQNFTFLGPYILNQIEYLSNKMRLIQFITYL